MEKYKQSKILNLMVLFLFAIVIILPGNRAMAEDITYVYVDGERVDFTNKPITENETSLIEFRPVFEKLGLEIDNLDIKILNDRTLIPLFYLDKLEEEFRGYGDLIDGIANGYGVIYWNEVDGGNIMYEGEFKNGQPDGQGSLYWHGAIGSGMSYTGGFKEGQLHGQGIEYLTDGTVEYDGEWKEGKPAI